MAITDELREWFKDRIFMANGWQEIHDIADRIDREHERAMREEYQRGANDGYDMGFASADDWLAQHEDAMAEHGWIKLPVDVDGVPIHVGDEVAFIGRMTVDATDGHNVFFFADNWADGVYCVRADELRHYHAPTVEDVLLDLLEEHSDPTCDATPSELAEKYAAKLRLAEGVE